MRTLTGLPWPRCLLTAFAASVFGAYIELISRGGDTVTVPAVNTAVLPALYFL